MLVILVFELKKYRIGPPSGQGEKSYSIVAYVFQNPVLFFFRTHCIMKGKTIYAIEVNT